MGPALRIFSHPRRNPEKGPALLRKALFGLDALADLKSFSWNPAVEAQAIDGAHSIEQTNRVFACRLVTRNRSRVYHSHI